MLIQFSVENFLSFDQETIFSMVAASGDEHPHHLVRDVPHKGQSVVRAAALYGANGAGKTNLVNAMAFSKDLILSGTRAGFSIPVKAFKLGNEMGMPSKFEFIFDIDGVLYNYGFRIDIAHVTEEWLFETPNSREILLFQRTTTDDGGVEIEFGRAFSGRSGKSKQFLNFVAQGTRPNQLFLTEARDRNVPGIEPVIRWFRDVLVVVPVEPHNNALTQGSHMFAPNLDFITGFLRDAGTGIENVRTLETPFDFNTDSLKLTEEDREKVVSRVAELSFGEVLDVEVWDGKRFRLARGKDGGPVQFSIELQHRGVNGKLVTFDREEESEGTQRLVNLLPALLMLRRQAEKVVVLDELDRRFHTLLSREFVECSLNSEGRATRSQLIFTTHDTNLLDLDLLRRDEIWFVEKDKMGASHLSSLAEYKVRSDLKIEKGYLNGRFGAIPFSGEPSQLGWFSNEKPGAVGSAAERSSVA